MTVATEELPPTAGAGPIAGRRRSALPFLLLGAAVLAGGLVGLRKLAFARTHVTTDNAQVDGHITAIAPRVQGFVQRVLADDNQPVAVGDTLVILDPRDVAARLAEAEAELASAQAAVGNRRLVGQATATLAAARSEAEGAAAQIEAARAALSKARADYDRYLTLADRRIIAPQQLDQAKWAVANATATLEATERRAAAASSETVAAGAGVRVAEADLAAARAHVEHARLQLGYTVILAPAAGVAARRSVEPGALVQIGQHLLSIVPDGTAWVTANLKETELDRVRVGDPVEFRVDAYPGTTFHGTIESVSPATGARFALLPPDNATGNFTKVVQRVPVRIAVDPARPADRPLRPGMSVDVTIAVR